MLYVCVISCRILLAKRKVNIWHNYICTCDDKSTIIYGFMQIINQSKDSFVIWHELLLVFDHYNKICHLQLILLSKDLILMLLPVSCNGL